MALAMNLVKQSRKKMLRKYMKNARLFLSLILFLSFYSVTMEPVSGMVKINCWKDVEPFAGKIVACFANSSYFNFSQCFPINDLLRTSNFRYGYISEQAITQPDYSSCYLFIQIVEAGTYGKSNLFDDAIL